MDYKEILGIFGVAFFGHAALVFLECLLERHACDLRAIRIPPFTDDEQWRIEGLLGVELHSQRRIRVYQVMAVVLVWSRILRLLGMVPIALYVLAIFASLAQWIIRSEAREALGVAIVVLLIGALGSQLFYLILKFKSGVPGILCSLHDDYKDVPQAKVLLDLFPSWTGRA